VLHGYGLKSLGIDGYRPGALPLQMPDALVPKGYEEPRFPVKDAVPRTYEREERLLDEVLRVGRGDAKGS
jgi:hypothetical protein